MCVLGYSKNIWTSVHVAKTKSSLTLCSVIYPKNNSLDYYSKYFVDGRMFCLIYLSSVAQSGAAKSSALRTRTYSHQMSSQKRYETRLMCASGLFCPNKFPHFSLVLYTWTSMDSIYITKSLILEYHAWLYPESKWCTVMCRPAVWCFKVAMTSFHVLWLSASIKISSTVLV